MAFGAGTNWIMNEQKPAFLNYQIFRFYTVVLSDLNGK